MNILSVFGGMECGRVAAERAGLAVEKYYSSEIDKHAIAVAQDNWPNLIQLGDITQWRTWDIDWSSIDLLMGGSPCQGFSLQGHQLNFDDERSKLFFVYVDILNHIKAVNKDVKFLLENVRMKKEWLDVITKYVGQGHLEANSSLVSAGSRPRHYWTNWKITLPADRDIKAADIIDGDHWLPATVRKGDPRPVILTGDKFLCLTATYYKGIRADGRPALATSAGDFNTMRDAGQVRALTPLECERLMTVPRNYTKAASNTQRYKMLGNGWTVEMITHFLTELKDQL
tara:strand:+ start:22644 stop:23501 length:858 start_codon:yes stop_codon:yes gene_type:complete